jgi:hypothetical protein
MRVPIFRLVNDDDPMDYEYPRAVSAGHVMDWDWPEERREVLALEVGQSATIGGGA